jgi:hypothetical protein
MRTHHAGPSRIALREREHRLSECRGSVPEPDLIDVTQRLRSYSDLEEVGADFGTSAPEYGAAEIFFAAKPQPQNLLIGRWAQSNTCGRLMGGQLSETAQALSNFTAVSAGSLEFSVDTGTEITVTGINLSQAASLGAVATAVQTALIAADLNCTVTWTGSQFVIKSDTTGAASAVTMPETPASGTNLAPLMGLTVAAGAYAVQGIVAESLLAAVTILDGQTSSWYWLSTDACTSRQASDVEAVSAYVQAASNPHAYFDTVQDANALNTESTEDVGYALGQTLAATEPARTGVQYSSTSPYAACGIIGFGCSINWLGSDTAPNFMFQAEGDVTAETLTTSQANSLDGKRYNYLANVADGLTFIVNGMMSGPNYIDEVVGSDWLGNYIQTNAITFLAKIGTKVAQTDAGMNQLENNVVTSLEQGITNGLLAPGTWNGPSFGALSTGEYLDTGYYVYVPPIATQTQATRATRKSPPFQIAAKLAGAVNDVDLLLNFNQ